ncbi:MAG: hypothetical protein J6B88_05670 [Clostridia bacterium]|nr:hypothetical protein [Clostridia bacterium]MBO5232096.1 hypothetical protein [Clostridia bacterium]
MKYSVGYQLREDPEFLQSIVRNKKQIHEVYFSWGDFANGRNSQLRQSNLTPWEAQLKQETELRLLSSQGLKFNLLFNATCYGKDSQSKAFFTKIGEAVQYIQQNIGLTSITTTSPLIAKFIKENFDGIDVRASVNMSIGTIEGMEYIKKYFDSFYLKRELNRDFKAISNLKKWCDQNGKVLYALANSGCLNNCSAHVFHDNLVSHESEIAAMDNGYSFEGVCRQYLSDEKNLSSLLDNTNYIRPEDIHHYEGIFSVMKLATRVSMYPERIIKAYLEDRSYSGSILDLLEPNHTGLLYPKLLENKKIISAIKNNKLIYSNLEEALIKLEYEI